MNSKRNIKKGLACIGLGLLFILLLCMDVAVFYLEHVLYQDIMTTGMTVWQHCLHFIVICTVWGCGSMALCGLAKEKELLPDSKNNVKRLSGSRIFMLVLIAAAGILFMSLDMPGMSLRLKPLSELHYFLKQYGRAGTAAFFCSISIICLNPSSSCFWLSSGSRRENFCFLFAGPAAFYGAGYFAP